MTTSELTRVTRALPLTLAVEALRTVLSGGPLRQAALDLAARAVRTLARRSESG